MKPNSSGAVRMGNRGIRQRRVLVDAICVVLLAIWLAAPLHANGEGGTIEHIVIVWLKEPGSHAVRDLVLEESRQLAAIPGVLSIKSGRVIPGNRPVSDSSFDVALVITLADAAALQEYLTHPVHVRLVEETLKPLVQRIQVYDFSSH